MKEIRIVTKAVSPIIINEDRQSSNAVSLDYIPGSTLRGALAAAYLRNGSASDQAFKSLFLSNFAIPNLFPASSAEDTPQVIPASVYSCKRHPGFIKSGGAVREAVHGVHDMLALQAASRLSDKMAASTQWECSCRQELKPFSGLWNGNLDSPAIFKASKSYNRFTGIDRLTRTVAQSIFYTSQSIDDFQCSESVDQPQYFSGTTRISKEGLKILQELSTEPLFVGADRTRGFGELELSIQDYESSKPDYVEWNRAFRVKLGEQAGDGFYFSVMLESHAILVDRFLRAVADLDLCIPDCKQVMRITKGVAIRGWNAAWGLPKQDDTGIRMGSIFLFRYTGNQIETLVEQLEQIRIEGIGLRREEGFGMVQIDNKLHTIKGVL